MQFPAILRRRAVAIPLILAVIAVGIILVRTVDESRSRVPLEVAEKVRNLSAEETEWQVAVTAAPGDVLEHFMLVRLSPDYSEPVQGVRINSLLYAGASYRQGTLVSSALGIGQGNADERAEALFGKTGIALSEIAPGEFIDFKWQTHIPENIAFAGATAPLLESTAAVSADGFTGRTARSVATLFSTEGRVAEAPRERLYLPSIFGMNPRRGYEDIGTGVVIAGNDLEGIKELRIAETGTKLVWRLVSNELLEAAIPAGLAVGPYAVEMVNTAGQTLANQLGFEIFPSKSRTVVVAATPSFVRSGEQRTVVLQGIHLAPDAQIMLRENNSKQVFALENAQAINARVLTAEIPSAISTGAYTILVGNVAQEAQLFVN